MQERLIYAEIRNRFDAAGNNRVRNWKRIYLEEAPKGLYVERRDRESTSIPRKSPKTVEEYLLAEVPHLRAEVDYLKNLQALVLEEERRQHKNAGSSRTEVNTYFRYIALNRSITESHVLLSPYANE